MFGRQRVARVELYILIYRLNFVILNLNCSHLHTYYKVEIVAHVSMYSDSDVLHNNRFESFLYG